jgi:hypothetical protein
MHVGEYHAGIILKRIEDTVTVMRIDVDISDSLEPGVLPQQLDGDSAIVEYAEPCGTVAPSMVEPSDGHECPTALS